MFDTREDNYKRIKQNLDMLTWKCGECVNTKHCEEKDNQESLYCTSIIKAAILGLAYAMFEVPSP
ncbi:MAG: hypothetical protein KAS32_08660 [Candidatus Peribacteraceae bacterium]|nr:hypothetical protein [Candidatus Peribacteraceae bacterium]